MLIRNRLPENRWDGDTETCVQDERYEAETEFKLSSPSWRVYRANPVSGKLPSFSGFQAATGGNFDAIPYNGRPR